MRKLVFTINMSLDGFIEGPNHDLDWSIADDQLNDFFSDLLNRSDIILFGRVVYQMMSSYWPTAPTDPNATPSMRRFAAVLNPMKKMVFSSTLGDVGWNTQLVHEVDPGEIQKLKSLPGRDLLLGGGASIAQAFMQLGLIDEYLLVVHPVAIGAGTALFKGMEQPLKMSYLWSEPFSSGVMALCYKPDGKV